MNCLLAALLLPLHFTAPADTLGADATGRMSISVDPVHAYVFDRLDARGGLTTVPGYADSTGTEILVPHAPGTRETVWLAPDLDGSAVTIYMMSLDRRGNLSAPSNGCVLVRRPDVTTQKRLTVTGRPQTRRRQDLAKRLPAGSQASNVQQKAQ